MASSSIQDLAQMLRDCRNAVVLTGAGISTESGIPDFRSPGTGLYSKIDPMDYLSVTALMGHPERFWKYFAGAFGTVTDAEPNAGHRVIAALEAAGYVSAVATQNIDGLHQKAGSRAVHEVHGHLRTVQCEACTTQSAMADALHQVEAEGFPKCSACGRRMRPDVVLFGDRMPGAYREALELARSAGMVLVVGSSLTVSPANNVAFEAKRVAIVNRDATPADLKAEVVIYGSAGETLTALAKELGLEGF